LVDGKPAGKVPYRVKRLPLPTAKVGNLATGSVQSSSFKAMGGVIVKLEDSEFDVQYEVVGYNVETINSNGDYVSIPNVGNKWTGNAADLISKLAPGKRVSISDIRVKAPDGVVRTLNGSLNYSLR
jgi:hypothetical protein